MTRNKTKYPISRLLRIYMLFPAILLTVSCVAGRFPSGRVRHVKCPPYLQKGDSIGLLILTSGLSSGLAPNEDTARIGQIFREWGFRVGYAPHLLDPGTAPLGVSDSARAADFQQMIDCPDIRAIVFYKGGYGAVHALDRIDWRKLRRSPKWIAGYSDITMIHLAASKWGVQTIHGTMPVSFRRDSVENDISVESLRRALTGSISRIEAAPHPLNRPGTATGRLTGGNLSLLYSAAGTPVDNDLRKGDWVLLIEDLGEYMYHLDRMMQNLYQSGKLARCKAVLVGSFTGMKLPERYGGISPEELIALYTKKYNIPVIFGFPVGHSNPNLSVYLGRKVKVNVTEQEASVTFL